MMGESWDKQVEWNEQFQAQQLLMKTVAEEKAWRSRPIVADDMICCLHAFFIGQGIDLKDMSLREKTAKMTALENHMISRGYAWKEDIPYKCSWPEMHFRLADLLEEWKAIGGEIGL